MGKYGTKMTVTRHVYSNVLAGTWCIGLSSFRYRTLDVQELVVNSIVVGRRRWAVNRYKSMFFHYKLGRKYVCVRVSVCNVKCTCHVSGFVNVEMCIVTPFSLQSISL